MIALLILLMKLHVWVNTHQRENNSTDVWKPLSGCSFCLNTVVSRFLVLTKNCTLWKTGYMRLVESHVACFPQFLQAYTNRNSRKWACYVRLRLHCSNTSRACYVKLRLHCSNTSWACYVTLRLHYSNTSVTWLMHCAIRICFIVLWNFVV